MPLIHVSALEQELALYKQTRADHVEAIRRLDAALKEKQAQVMACNGAIEAVTKLLAMAAALPDDTALAGQPEDEPEAHE